MKKSILERSLALEAAGFNLWREQTRLETQVGVAGWSREIAFALAEYDVVCLMLNQHAAASKLAEHEWSASGSNLS